MEPTGNVFSSDQIKLMGVASSIRPDHLSEDASKMSLSFVTRWLRENLKTSPDRSLDPKRIDYQSFADQTFKQMAGRLYGYLNRLGTKDPLNRPLDPDKLTTRPQLCYDVNRAALISLYRQISLHDLLFMAVPEGLEEEHLEGV